MHIIPQPIATLIDEFAKLPGVGPRSAERLTFFLLRSDTGQETRLGQALLHLREQLTTCQTCHNYSDGPECVICRNPSRSHHLVTVVEEPLDVVAIEKTGLYDGVYHVLGGVISPIDGVGPAQLEISSLLERVGAKKGDTKITELVLATNPTTEGEATGLYIRKQLEELDAKIKITRLARGLPVGGDLEYADQITLGRALQERQAF
ncbi:MAG TPA: recombination mediator RecR [Candidatus Saccharimonadales bacterium]|nr:recombination mediator RecR [Candidatus Saccharimonadales bacterium]